MTPSASAACFGAAVLLGAGLGLLYGFLRPLRPRLTHLADLLFVIAAFYSWIYLAFAICGGDIRLAYTAGLLVGGFAWEMTVGKWLRPLFFGFWRCVSKFFRFFTRPVEKISKKFIKSVKKLLANEKKWFTIGWNIHK